MRAVLWVVSRPRPALLIARFRRGRETLAERGPTVLLTLRREETHHAERDEYDRRRTRRYITALQRDSGQQRQRARLRHRSDGPTAGPATGRRRAPYPSDPNSMGSPTAKFVPSAIASAVGHDQRPPLTVVPPV